MKKLYNIVTMLQVNTAKTGNEFIGIGLVFIITSFLFPNHLKIKTSRIFEGMSLLYLTMFL